MASLKDLILQLSPEQQHYIARLVASMPESEGGLNMPLENTAKQRAKALGYTTKAFRGTSGIETEARDRVFVSPDFNVANNYAGYFPIEKNPEFGISYEDLINKTPQGNVMPLLIKNAEEAKKASYMPEYEMISGAPNIRSRFAAFNPWLKDSSNILASIIAAGGLSRLANEYLDQPMNMGPDVARVARETGIQPMSRGEALKNAISAVPGIGDALAVAEGLQGAIEGDWAKAGLGALAAAPMVGAIKTYHGSPRAEPFTKFSKEFMGSGEGAQAFSKGHYVAEQPKVAKNYYRPGGSMYEVSLEWPDAAREASDPMSREHFFQWDKPFRKQPEHVQKALLDIVEENPPEIEKYKEFLRRNWKIEEPDMVDFVKMYPNVLIRDAKLESHLYNKGIPGVAFADQATRIKPIDQRTYNYSVYGDEIPRIVGRNNPSLLDILGIKE